MTQAFDSISLKAKLLILIHISLGSYIVYPILITDILKLQNWMDPRYLQLVFSFLLLIPALIWMKPFLLKSIRTFNAHPFKESLSIVQTLPILILSSGLLNWIAVSLTHVDASTNQVLLGQWFNQDPLLVIFEALVFAPIYEELIFRGFIQQLISKINIQVGLWGSSLLFGLAHMITSSTSLTLSDFAFLPTYTILGYILAKRALKSDTIISSMGLHFINNLIGIIALMVI